MRYSLIFCLLAVLPSYSQVLTADTLAEAVVSSSRVPTPLVDVPRSIQVLEREEIASSPARSVAELLEGMAGVDVRQRGLMGAQSDLSIRGSSFDQTLVLINGVRMTDPQTGHHQMNLAIEPEDIERIEVLQGGASRVLGPNAFAGAVNIITRNPGVSGFQLRASGGEHALAEFHGSGTLAFSNHSHRISLSNRSADGFYPNTDLRLRNLFWQSEARLGNHALTFMAGQNQKEFGAMNFYTALFPLQFEATRAEFVSLTDRFTAGRFEMKVLGYYRRHFDRFELFRESTDYYRRTEDGFLVMKNDTAPAWYGGHNYHRTDVRGAEFNAAIEWKGGKTAFGMDYRHEQVWSNVLGQPLEEFVQVPGEPDFARYTRSDRRENTSWYAEHQLKHGRHRFNAGLLLNHNSEYGTDWYPGADYGYKIGERVMPFVSVNRSLRFPTFTDLYYNRGGAVGSLDLRPESSVNYEAGSRFFFKNINGHVALFVREGRDLIDWIRFYGSDTTRAANITQVNIRGIETSWQIDVAGATGLEHAPRVRVSYSFMQADTASTDFESNYVLDFLRHKFDMSLSQTLSKTVTLDFRFSYQSRIGSHVTAGEVIPFEPVALLDLRLAHTEERLTLFAEVSNLLDSRNVDIGNVLLPGRWMRAGIAIRFSRSDKTGSGLQRNNKTVVPNK